DREGPVDHARDLLHRTRPPAYTAAAERVIGHEAERAKQAEPAERLELRRPPAKPRPHPSSCLSGCIRQRRVLCAVQKPAKEEEADGGGTDGGICDELPSVREAKHSPVEPEAPDVTADRRWEPASRAGGEG